MSTKIVDGFSGDLIEPDFSGLDFKFSRMEKAAARDELSLDAIDACIATIKALCEDRGEVLERGNRVFVGGIEAFAAAFPTMPDWYVKFLYGWNAKQMIADAVALASSPDDTLRSKEHAVKAKPNDGWITWEGGSCPVAPDVYATVRLRAGYSCTARAGRCCWERTDGHGDIVAYRIEP